jgi:5-methylthioribose kinase
MYLGEGKCLIQGDYYPGSWIASENGIKIIDPEFSFMGYAEFDLGVLIAHLYLTGHSKETMDKIFSFYERPQIFDNALVAGFAGTEILRRLLGVAQLPLVLSLQEKQETLQIAAEWIKTGKIKL